MGRPALPDDERRDKPLRIRLSGDERDAIDAGAEAAGEPNTSRWARQVLLEAAERLARRKRKK